MDRPSPRARAMLDAYRRSTGASSELREELRARLERSTRPPPSRAGWVVAIAATTAVAAGLLLWVARSDRSIADERTHDHAAPFVHDRVTETKQTEPVPQPVDPTPLDAPSGPSLDHEPATTTSTRPAPRARKPRGLQQDEAEAGPDLAAEMAVLRRAGAQIRTGEGRRALTTLEEHARRFPQGQLVEDREALRVQALCAAGDDAGARAAARAFESAHPRSPHLERVRSLAACVPGR